jgi:hypothetical protein
LKRYRIDHRELQKREGPVTSSNRATYCKAGAHLITRCNADTCGDIDRAGWSINSNQGTDPDPAYDNISLCPYCGTRLPEQTLAPVHEDKRLIVIDLGGGCTAPG